MRKNGSIFPDRIDSYSQLPLLQENSVHAIASNCLRSAIVKIEEVIGEKVLESDFYRKVSSLRERFHILELEIQNLKNKNIIQIENNFNQYDIVTLSDSGWRKLTNYSEPSNIGIVLSKNHILISGIIYMNINSNLNPGDRIMDISSGNIVKSIDDKYVGTVLFNENNLIKIILKNTW